MADKIDKTDLLLLEELQKNADRTVYQLAKYLGLKRSTVYNRINKLKQQNVIKGSQTIIDQAKLGLPLCVFILMRIKKAVKMEEICLELSKDLAVEEMHPITGSFDLIIKARFKDIHALSDFTMRKLSKPLFANKILRTETMLGLGTYKEYFRAQN
ncbi:Lrp/AsnC family transcriptional regulator [Candidatus Woesearchaeota archaeon]|nr:Lrp/AsnC family transcriptional regulator [Candidatus Woesearchaeota archaeon]